MTRGEWRFKLAGFVILIATIIFALINAGEILGRVILPLALGVIQLLRILNSVPQTFWWTSGGLVAVGFLAASLRISNLRSGRRSYSEGRRARTAALEELMGDSQSEFSRKKIAHILINLYLANRGEDEINIHQCDAWIAGPSAPRELQHFYGEFVGNTTAGRDEAGIRYALEEPLAFIRSCIEGEHS